MKEIELREVENDNNNKEIKSELTSEKARELLGTNENNESISDERLEKIINSVKVFCKIAYELYSEEYNDQKEKHENDIIISLDTESNQQLQEAA